jgi:hypothetical protein
MKGKLKSCKRLMNSGGTREVNGGGRGVAKDSPVKRRERTSYEQRGNERR